MSTTDTAIQYLSLEEMLSTLLESLRDRLGVDTAAVLLLDEERGVLVARAARGLEEEVRQGVQVPLARGFAGRIAAQNKPIIIEDLDHAEVVNPILRQRGIRSMLGVPVHVDHRVIGVMHVGTLRRRAFGDHDVGMLQLAADRAARAIDDARLAEHRTATAAMQRTLLPEVLPEIPGVRFSAKYLPAGTDVKVGGDVKIGGDWYDVFRLPNGHLALVIGDVVGRGVLAASVMAAIRTGLRAYLLEGHNLTRATSLVNDLLVSMGRDRGATLSILEFDLEASELELLTAGHLPPLLIPPDGEPRLLEQEHGLPVGISVGQRYSTCRYSFPAGSTLLLYTDGLIERRGESIDVGFSRLAAAAAQAARSTDSSFADRVYRAILDHITLDDDVALLAIETLAFGDSIGLTLSAGPHELAGLRSTIGRWLTSGGVNEGDRFDITLSASEAAANVIQHAYGAQEASFTVHCERVADQVTVTVRDQGRWRTQTLEGGGRGLAIIQALMDDVEIDSTSDGTVLRMSKKLGPVR